VTGPLFFVEPPHPLERGSRLTLSAEDSRHALRSLRLRPDEGVTISDDAGLVAEARLVGEEDRLAVVEIESVRRVVRRGTLVSVAVSPPKGERLGWMVQKLAEIGVDEVVPIRSSRSVREWRTDRSDHALRRLEAVAREASMQSRRAFVMRITEPTGLDDAITVPGATVVVLDPSGRPLRAVLPDDATAVRLAVGPEGGFAADELARTSKLGATVAGLGEQVLRTETAAIVGATLVLHRYGRLG
jgi:16S rRNA (uracil1498-N3)-methyltransferase